MTHATIYHCPETPAVLDFAEDVIVALMGRDVLVEVADGEDGQFTVVVDGDTVLSRDADDLPDVEDVVEAVTEAGSLYMAV